MRGILYNKEKHLEKCISIQMDGRDRMLPLPQRLSTDIYGSHVVP